jgi:sugar phosphate isomerase/epimerase
LKLGVLTVLFQNEPFEKMLDIVQGYGLEAVELGTGNYPGNSHCNPDELLEDESKLRNFKRALESRNLEISALSCHGNPLHPDKQVARQYHETWRKTILLAEKLGIERVNAFSGCPGDSENAKSPNWVTCAWPPDYLDLLNWQWSEKLIPYWKKEARYASEHGIEKIAFEMHPGFMVYNPETLLKLREAVGPSIGANYDPSHLVWQGIDPVESIKLLGKHHAIFHVHAKDVYLDPSNIRINGVLDAKPYHLVADRSWTFRSVGYGLSELDWKNMVSALRVIGYDYVLSIEHEDILASPQEGFLKAVNLLKNCIFNESPGEIWWA